ncbi:MAG: deoxyribose-phosphate aldolase [Prevotella sp.]|jgi:deoxyribose-phosphate aldolase|nr:MULTISPECIES: deoxyribose-phosphate aldolase [unclassified Prevotella]MCH3969503.1 deoxyribose-phosphate aldolase [Prevotella sp.]MCH3991720.1 deoxyribose-phosphate aldolase [Prevotella sp.]MCH4018880.1 deoxyribose-phosphate aldolase [Prevotella sp.]MCH4099507.1 deoxyribose-phosphate aldolase [Prevotella sp.]MCH4185769.1 deoxyribose-phosphate aldolase [Prevotella sp.]
MAYRSNIQPTIDPKKLNELEKKRKEKPEKSKYDQALEKYDTHLNEEEINKTVKKLIAEKVADNDTKEVKKFLLGSVELTSLHTTDTEEKILAMTEKVNNFYGDYPGLPHVAAICIYPVFTELVAKSLEVDGVEITNVCGNFPSSQARMEVKIAETSLAIADGATNIDIVMPVGKFLSNDYEGVCDDIDELKEVCKDVPLKVILETGDLGSYSNIKKAAILAMYAGANYIKTSTGKEKIGATPESVYIMCQAIKEYYDETGIQIGLKPAGGMKTVMDAVIYYTIVKEVLGNKWLTNKWFRLGTSSLANLLLSEILERDIKYF